MATDSMNAYAGRNAAVPIMEGNAAIKDRSYCCDNLVDLKDCIHAGEAHTSSSRVLHFRILHVKTGVWKEVEIAGVIEMHVRNNDVSDLVQLHPKCGEPLAHRGNEVSPTFARHDVVESGIDNVRSLLAHDRPDKIVDRL